MISLRTNLTSLLAQNSLRTSSNKLNQAIERMTTGFKINNAKDNAANYSISTNLSTKIGAYQVAEENTAMGLDMVTTASETLSLIEDKLSRLRALQEQAMNGTYGDQSLQAINQEVNAIVDEIERLTGTAEYNGINLFGEQVSGFIQPVAKRDTSTMTKLSEMDETQALAVDTYSISTAEELAQLATMTNNGLVSAGTEFVLANNIDLSAYSSGEGWVPIGIINPGDANDVSKAFKGIFDGNGYTITGLKIDRNANYQGLFGRVYQAVIKNIALKNVDIVCNDNAGALVGTALETDIFNVSVQGNLHAGSGRGLLAGYVRNCEINYCYSEGEIIGLGNSNGGGLIGVLDNSNLLKSYSCATVKDTTLTIGGLIGFAWHNSNIEDCYSSGVVDAGLGDKLGGFAGSLAHTTVTNCYTTANVINGINEIGGFTGALESSNLNNCGVLTQSDNLLGLITGQVYASSNVTDFYYDSYYHDKGLALFNIDAGGGNINSTNLYSYNGSVPFEYDLHYVETHNNRRLQVGSDGESMSQIDLDLAVALNGVSELRGIGRNNSKDYLAQVDSLLSVVSAKQTEFGAVENRLTSALEEIGIKYENLVSTRSTIRDADISEVSSQYIQQQILQQASSTLLATANQSPDLALRLIMNSTL